MDDLDKCARLLQDAIVDCITSNKMDVSTVNIAGCIGFIIGWQLAADNEVEFKEACLVSFRENVDGGIRSRGN